MKTLKTIGEFFKGLAFFMCVVTILQTIFIIILSIFFFWGFISGTFLITETIKENAKIIMYGYSRLMFFTMLSIIYIFGEYVISLLNKERVNNGNRQQGDI